MIGRFVRARVCFVLCVCVCGQQHKQTPSPFVRRRRRRRNARTTILCATNNTHAYITRICSSCGLTFIFSGCGSVALAEMDNDNGTCGRFPNTQIRHKLSHNDRASNCHNVACAHKKLLGNGTVLCRDSEKGRICAVGSWGSCMVMCSRYGERKSYGTKLSR